MTATVCVDRGITGEWATSKISGSRAFVKPRLIAPGVGSVAIQFLPLLLSRSGLRSWSDSPCPSAGAYHFQPR